VAITRWDCVLLRNFMERVVVMARSGSDAMAELEPDPIAPAQDGAEVELDLPYKESKMRWVDQFEMTYVSEILRRNKGNVAGAAREAGVDRTYLFRLIRKYGLKK
jgi:transcriptional regulator of acetoin/glycerol metabolism